MTYKGEVKDGVVVLEGGASLPNGTLVEVHPIVATASEPLVEIDSIFDMGDLAVDTGVPDLATNIDHYLYGHPKASDGK